MEPDLHQASAPVACQDASVSCVFGVLHPKPQGRSRGKQKVQSEEGRTDSSSKQACYLVMDIGKTPESTSAELPFLGCLVKPKRFTCAMSYASA